MSWTYSCPKCQSVVNPDETVILVASREGVNALIGLHPQPGNYTIYTPPGVSLNNGDTWDFFCPVCHEDLKSEQHDNLCALTIWHGAERRTALFSRVVGERATYLVREKAVEQALGDHATRYEHTMPRYRYTPPDETGDDNPRQ